MLKTMEIGLVFLVLDFRQTLGVNFINTAVDAFCQTAG